MAVLQLRAHAKAKELFDDFSLGVDRRGCTGATTTRVLHGEMKRGGPGFVFQGRITAGPEETAHGGCTSRPDGAMQWSSPVLVRRMVGAFLKQAAESRHLFFGIPRGNARRTTQIGGNSLLICVYRVCGDCVIKCSSVSYISVGHDDQSPEHKADECKRYGE
jgi:hypothetical protein